MNAMKNRIILFSLCVVAFAVSTAILAQAQTFGVNAGLNLTNFSILKNNEEWRWIGDEAKSSHFLPGFQAGIVSNLIFSEKFSIVHRCCCEEWVLRDTEKYIKVSGWHHLGDPSYNPDALMGWPFILVDQSKILEFSPFGVPHVRFEANNQAVYDAINTKFKEADNNTVKWYVRSKPLISNSILHGLHKSGMNVSSCSFRFSVEILSADDVQFE